MPGGLGRAESRGSRLLRFSQVKETAHHVQLKATRLGRSAVRNMPLKSSDQTEVAVTVEIPDTAQDGLYEFFVRQVVDGHEVGRVTKRLMVGDYPYVANRRSGEVHVANCDWVVKMSGRNKVAYRDLNLALKHGFNGCLYCLTDYDTDR